MRNHRFKALFSAIFTLLFTLCSLLGPEARADRAAAQAFVNQYLAPLLAGRQNFYALGIVDQADGSSLIRIKSGTNGRTLGQYEIRLNPSVTELPGRSVPVETNWVQVGGSAYIGLKGQVELPLHPKEDPTGLLRGLFRSDFLLHPMMTPPGQPTQLVPLQKDVLNQLLEFSKAAREKQVATEALAIMPPGLGKTVLAGKFVQSEINKAPSAPYKVFFIVQNKEILDEATLKLQNLLGLKPTQVLRGYGGGKKENLLSSSAQLIAASRTAMYGEISDYASWRERYKGRVYVVIDEVHHVGRMDGEFDRILNEIKKNAKPGDALLGLSATPWHLESDIIERVFRNQVATAFLTVEEKENFLRERKFIAMARLMLFRAMAEGYLSPLHSYRQVRYLEQDDASPVLARNFLMDWAKKYDDLSEQEKYEQLKKEITVHVPLIRQMIKEMLSVVRKDSNGKLIAPNRGVIFVPSIAHANIYAYLLNQYAPKGANRIEVRPFHSGLNGNTRDGNMDWFRDQEIKSQGGRVARQEVKESPTHKYLIAIRALGEGVDEPRINHVILAKPYSEVDMVGMLELIQNLGRGSRLNYSKTDFTVSDFTGDMLRLIFQDMDQSLVSKFFVNGGTMDFSEEMVAHQQKVTPVKPDVIVDYDTLKDQNFQAEVVAVPQMQAKAAQAEDLKTLTWIEYLSSETAAQKLLFEAKTQLGIKLSLTAINAIKRYGFFRILNLSQKEILMTPIGGQEVQLEIKDLLLTTKLWRNGEENLELRKILDLKSPFTASSKPNTHPRLLESLAQANPGIFKRQPPVSTSLLTWRQYLSAPSSLAAFIGELEKRGNFSLKPRIKNLFRHASISFLDLVNMNEIDFITHPLASRKDVEDFRSFALKTGAWRNGKKNQFLEAILDQPSPYNSTEVKDGGPSLLDALYKADPRIFNSSEATSISTEQNGLGSYKKLTWKEYLSHPASFDIMLAEMDDVGRNALGADLIRVLKLNRASFLLLANMSEAEFLRLDHTTKKSLPAFKAFMTQTGLWRNGEKNLALEAILKRQSPYTTKDLSDRASLFKPLYRIDPKIFKLYKDDSLIHDRIHVELATWKELLSKKEYLEILLKELGITQNASQQILSHFKNPLNFLGTTEEALIELDGVGPISARKVKETLEIKGLWQNGKLNPKLAANLDLPVPTKMLENQESTGLVEAMDLYMGYSNPPYGLHELFRRITWAEVVSSPEIFIQFIRKLDAPETIKSVLMTKFITLKDMISWTQSDWLAVPYMKLDYVLDFDDILRKEFGLPMGKIIIKDNLQKKSPFRNIDLILLKLRKKGKDPKIQIDFSGLWQDDAKRLNRLSPEELRNLVNTASDSQPPFQSIQQMDKNCGGYLL